MSVTTSACQMRCTDLDLRAATMTTVGATA